MPGSRRRKNKCIGREPRLAITVCGMSDAALAAWWRRLGRDQRHTVMTAMFESMARLVGGDAGAAGVPAILTRRKRICAGAVAGENKPC
jgi:hypothetical protein